MKSRKGSVLFGSIDVHVGKRVRIRRKLLGMSQTALGKAVGLSFQQIQKYERGANRIGASRLFEFSQILDVPVSFFFDDMPAEISGRTITETPDLNTYDIPDAEELARAYYKVPDQNVRKTMRELAKSIAKSRR